MTPVQQPQLVVLTLPSRLGKYPHDRRKMLLWKKSVIITWCTGWQEGSFNRSRTLNGRWRGTLYDVRDGVDTYCYGGLQLFEGYVIHSLTGDVILYGKPAFFIMMDGCLVMVSGFEARILFAFFVAIYRLLSKLDINPLLRAVPLLRLKRQRTPGTKKMQ